MNDSQPTPDINRADDTPQGYEPPRVETVLTSDDLAREVQYAGAASQFDSLQG